MDRQKMPPPIGTPRDKKSAPALQASSSTTLNPENRDAVIAMLDSANGSNFSSALHDIDLEDDGIDHFAGYPNFNFNIF